MHDQVGMLLEFTAPPRVTLGRASYFHSFFVVSARANVVRSSVFSAFGLSHCHSKIKGLVSSCRCLVYEPSLRPMMGKKMLPRLQNIRRGPAATAHCCYISVKSRFYTRDGLRLQVRKRFAANCSLDRYGML